MKIILKIILIISLLMNSLLLYKLRDRIANKISIYLPSKAPEWTKKLYEKPYSEDANKPLATYSIFSAINYLLPDSSNINYNPLPDSLFIPIGGYTFYGVNYYLSKEGVYRFIYPGKDNEQRIVFDGDIDTLLSSIAWIVTHGNSDDKLDNNSLLQKATDSKLLITCGPISVLSKYICEAFGIKSRVVAGMTNDKWNNYDNRHTLIELYREINKKWVLYDLDNNCYFTKNDEPLSFIELSNCVVNKQDYQITRISQDTKLAVNSFSDKNGYQYDFYSESVIASDNSLKNWYSRVLQVPMIKEGSYYYFYGNDSTTEKIVKYSSSYKPINTCEKYLEQFYSENYNLEKLRLMCKKH